MIKVNFGSPSQFTNSDWFSVGYLGTYMSGKYILSLVSQTAVSLEYIFTYQVSKTVRRSSRPVGAASTMKP
jgi:hypothetical protein